MRGALLLRKVEGFGKEVVCVVPREHSQGLGDCLHFKLASLLALFPLRIGHGALLLQHHEELFISGQRLFGVGNILLGLCIFLISIGQFLCLGINLSLPGCNFIFLCCLQLFVGLLVSHFFFLGR